MFNLTNKPAKFFKDMGFKTKKMVLQVLQKEAEEKNTSINLLFDSEENFVVFCENVLMYELIEEEIKEFRKKIIAMFEKFETHFNIT